LAQGQFFTSDYWGNIYVVNGHQLAKYDKNGQQISTYSNKTLGAISFVDASNPLRLLLFYKDFGQIIFLDDVLSILGSAIALEELGFDQAILSCTSVSDGIWLYDPQDFQLKRIDQSLNVTHQSGNINQLTGIEVNPNFMIEYNNFVYLNNPATGIMVFDMYGTYFKTLPLKDIKQFQLTGQHLFYYKNGALNSYDLKTLEQHEMVIPVSESKTKDVRLAKEPGLLIVFKEKQLDLFLIED